MEEYLTYTRTVDFSVECIWREISKGNIASAGYCAELLAHNALIAFPFLREELSRAAAA